MIIDQIITLGNQDVCRIRNAKVDDVDNIMEIKRKTTQETDFLMQAPDEIDDKETLKQMICAYEKDERQVLLLAQVGDVCVGMSQLSMVGKRKRVAHRCNFAISIIKDYWGQGIGTALFEAMLYIAKANDYEQVELEVVESNERGIQLYKKMGFEVYGKRPCAMRYENGNYISEVLMYKTL